MTVEEFALLLLSRLERAQGIAVAEAEDLWGSDGAGSPAWQDKTGQAYGLQKAMLILEDLLEEIEHDGH